MESGLEHGRSQKQGLPRTGEGKAYCEHREGEEGEMSSVNNNGGTEEGQKEVTSSSESLRG